MLTQEFDFTPAQATATCNKPFQPNPLAEACFNDKDACRQRGEKGLLTGPEKQALGMLQYPPKTDRWGRQAFDYADDNVYDDYYDQDYQEPQLESGDCLGSDVCGQSATATAASGSSSTGGRRRSLLAPTPADALLPAAPAPSGAAAAAVAPAEAVSGTTANTAAASAADGSSTDGGSSDDEEEGQGGDTDTDSADNNTPESDADEDQESTETEADGDSSESDSGAGDTSAAASEESDSEEDGDAPGSISTEVNAKDTLDGSGYDPAWGEGPYGETLCDAPPFRAFNYYGLVVRGGSSIRISASTWTLYDQSRVFIQDSTLTLEDGATLHLMNSTIVLMNSTLVVNGGSEIILERSSGLHLYQSRVTGDNALYAVPAEKPKSGSTWKGKPWLQRGDYRASAGGGLPVSMGVKPGVQLGSYPARVLGFDMEARMLPAAGCSCKKPLVTMTADTAWTDVPDGASLFAGLV
ncbi:hypothetical protein COO60DRAFT_437682 [Scenedesmus sp. NREL 46B-D3]|nr:hypothetical protein COO60DRAFT_437682 [Scenedesmus sp. NREL 46B-D3]